MTTIASPIQYTSRTFNTIMLDINSDPELVDKPEWFKRIVAGVGDMLSMLANATANNSFLRTAFTRQAMEEICFLIDYHIPDTKTSSGTIAFYLDVDKLTVDTMTFQISELAASSTANGNIPSRRFEPRDSATWTLNSIQCDNSTISNNSIVTSRRCLTGEKVRVSQTVPQGLSAGTDYYLINVDNTHAKFASTTNNARLGIAVPINYTANTCLLTFYSFTVTLYQQETRSNQSIGTSDGIKAWQEYQLPDLNPITETLSVVVADTLWTQVDNLVYSKINEKHYQVIVQNNGLKTVLFGNNEYGKIPENDEIMVTYSFGGGKISNIDNIGIIKNYLGGNEYILGCFNCTRMTGGDDPQSIEIARRIAPATIRSQDRFITAADGETLSVRFGGISQARCLRNFYGNLSAKIVTIAIGGGNLSPESRAALTVYLQSRTILNSIDVRVEVAQFLTIDVECQVHVLGGYTASKILSLMRVGFKLFFTEIGQEINDTYVSYGIENTLDLINTALAESVTYSDSATIENMLKQIELYGIRTFGDRIDQSNLIALLQTSIPGIEYLNIINPILPIILEPDQITTIGTISIGEI